MFAILLDATNKNLLLGFMPESLGLLLFGIGLIAFAVSLRWVFNRNEETSEKVFPAVKAQSTRRKTAKAEARA